MPEIAAPSQRVLDAAARKGVTLDIVTFDESTHTAEDAARAVGAEVGQIVKSLVFVADGAPILVLASGSNRVDVERVRQELGVGEVRRADGDEARSATGFAIGGVPPFGHARTLTVLLDRDLLGHERVWAAAGLPDAVFAIAPDALMRASGARVADVAQPAAA